MKHCSTNVSRESKCMKSYMENVERQWKIKVLDKNKSNIFCYKEKASRLEDTYVYLQCRERISLCCRRQSVCCLCVKSRKI